MVVKHGDEADAIWHALNLNWEALCKLCLSSPYSLKFIPPELCNHLDELSSALILHHHPILLLPWVFTDTFQFVAVNPLEMVDKAIVQASGITVYYSSLSLKKSSNLNIIIKFKYQHEHVTCCFFPSSRSNTQFNPFWQFLAKTPQSK